MFIQNEWQKQQSVGTTLRFARALSDIFVKRAGGHASEVHDAVRVGDWNRLLSFTPPVLGITANEYYNAAQAKACFSALECLPNGIDRKAVAMKTFLDGEYRCGLFNHLFELRINGHHRFSPETEAVLHLSSEKICDLLGEPPSIREVPLRFSVGGATTTIKKKDSDLRNLIAGTSNASEELMEREDLLSELLTSCPNLCDYHLDSNGGFEFEIQSSLGILNFVRKNAKTERVVTGEPDLTKIVQNGYGDWIRSRIKRRGIDLQDSERQSELARIGSITGGIATLDLKNASGLMGLYLVRDQFPPAWFDIFTWARTSEVYHPDFKTASHTRLLNAYAGMGNGLTFPIESILFHCLSLACCEYLGVKHPIVSVYGDDIIVSVEAAALIKTVFFEIGLIVNEEKSFVDGPFRESCGSDWFSGYDVRPVFVRDLISIELLYSLHNQFFAKGDEEVCDFILTNIRDDLRIFGPPGKGDGHLHSHEWKDHASFISRDGMAHYTYQTVSLKALFSFTVSKGDWLVPMLSVDAANRNVMMIEDSGLYLRDKGLLYQLPDGFLLKGRRSQFRNMTVLSDRKLQRYSSEKTRKWALSFEPCLLPAPVQTGRLRSKRGWDLKFSTLMKPDANLAVFGTPLPGSSEARITTSSIFG